MVSTVTSKSQLRFIKWMDTNKRLATSLMWKSVINTSKFFTNAHEKHSRLLEMMTSPGSPGSAP